ncbi:MAG: alanine--glyoxylate aminotransferase family protein [Firmicutes bacterium]|nr:alanine--glyoxylate aminotransferase family protein [Bacillota bacterium]
MSDFQYFMIPGPTQLPPDVLGALSAPMVNHRGPEFKEIMDKIHSNLQTIYKTKNDIITLTCSGSGALEASIVNFLNKGDKALVISIGNFGQRYFTICQKYGIDAELIDFAWGEALDPEIVLAKLAADTKHEIKAVIMQHNETSTGVYNNIKAIAEGKKDHPALTIVDAVSSLGACPLETDAWGLDIVVSASQKALMAPPGLAFISVSERAWKIAESCTNNRFYFDLLNAREFKKIGQTPFTPSVTVAYGVLAATERIVKQGIDNYVAEHFLRRDVVRAGIRGLGLQLLADDDCASPAVTTILLPEGIKPEDIREPMRTKFNIIIAGGMGKYKDTTIRIGHIGFMNMGDILVTLACLEMVLKQNGYELELGCGVAAAQKLLMEKL